MTRAVKVAPKVYFHPETLRKKTIDTECGIVKISRRSCIPGQPWINQLASGRQAGRKQQDDGQVRAALTYSLPNSLAGSERRVLSVSFSLRNKTGCPSSPFHKQDTLPGLDELAPKRGVIY
jgi:hypothetical protein